MGRATREGLVKGVLFCFKAAIISVRNAFVTSVRQGEGSEAVSFFLGWFCSGILCSIAVYSLILVFLATVELVGHGWKFRDAETPGDAAGLDQHARGCDLMHEIPLETVLEGLRLADHCSERNVTLKLF